MEELSRIALVGTSKHAAAASADVGHPAEALLARAAADDTEHVFLLRAGTRAVFDACGRVARTDIAAPAPAPGERRPTVPQELTRLLEAALAPDFRDLLLEFIKEIASAGMLLPAELLPAVLSIRDASVREGLLPVLGERARWLSQFNPHWQWASQLVQPESGPDRATLTRQWEEGTIGQRCAALETLRQSDSAEARQWLEGVIDKEKADHRARLLATCEVMLSAQDEALLESRLDDRSEQVRRVAAGLLARINGSALAARMRLRADGMLSAHSAGMLRKKIKLVCQAPAAIDKSWERDGVPSKAPAGRGKRALWTESVLAAVPPSHWSRSFQAEPSALIAAILKDDSAPAVLAGWTRAAVAFADVDQQSVEWLRPLWDEWLATAKRTRGEKSRDNLQQHLQALLPAMPDAENALRAVLSASAAESNVELNSLLSVLPRPWSDSFGRDYLRAVQSALRRKADDRAYQWSGTLRDAACALHRQTLGCALEPWDTRSDNTDGWHARAVNAALERFIETVQLRKRFYDELA